ncbi:MAG: ATP-binding protein, partial [Luteolibacter sp.]
GQARNAVRALDAIVWTVNPKNDVLAVTLSYLCQMAQDLTRDTEIRCRLEVPEELPDVALGAMVRHNLLLAVKEAVHNVIKHSAASVMRLRIECGADSFCLEVSDNGVAFDIATATNHRSGLDSMRQRMVDIGGAFNLISAPGNGTTVRFEIPTSAVQ